MNTHQTINKAVNTLRAKLLRTSGGRSLSEFLSHAKKRRAFEQFLVEASEISSAKQFLYCVRGWLENQRVQLFPHDGGRTWNMVQEILRKAFKTLKDRASRTSKHMKKHSSSQSLDNLVAVLNKNRRQREQRENTIQDSYVSLNAICSRRENTAVNTFTSSDTLIQQRHYTGSSLKNAVHTLRYQSNFQTGKESSAQWYALSSEHLHTDAIQKLMDLLFRSGLVRWVAPASFQNFLEKHLEDCIFQNSLDLSVIRGELINSSDLPIHELDNFLQQCQEIGLPWDVYTPVQEHDHAF